MTESMKNQMFRIFVVMLVTAMSVLLVPGVDDAVELVFQLAVLLVSR